MHHRIARLLAVGAPFGAGDDLETPRRSSPDSPNNHRQHHGRTRSGGQEEPPQ